MTRLVPTRLIVQAAVACLAFTLATPVQSEKSAPTTGNSVDQQRQTLGNTSSTPISTVASQLGPPAWDARMTFDNPGFLREKLFPGTQTANYCVPMGVQCSRYYPCCPGLMCMCASSRCFCYG